MRTVIVELRDSNALRLLKDLELASIIRLIYNTKNEEGTLKLSKRLRGGISKERAQELNVELEKIRNEWEEKNIS